VGPCLVFFGYCMLTLQFAYVEVHVLHVEVCGRRPTVLVRDLLAYWP